MRVIELDNRRGAYVVSDPSLPFPGEESGDDDGVVPYIFQSSFDGARKFSRRNHSRHRLNLNLASPPPPAASPVFSPRISFPFPLFPEARTRPSRNGRTLRQSTDAAWRSDAGRGKREGGKERGMLRRGTGTARVRSGFCIAFARLLAG